MKDWFSQFEACLDGDKAPGDLIGAGTATSERAMGHYRFQHQAKYREAVEDSFPVLLRLSGAEWDGIWKNFWAQNEASPRSLDWVSETFVNHFLKTPAPESLKELARFELALDSHSWSHKILPLRSDLTISEDCQVILGNYEVVSFSAPVTEIYSGDADSGSGPQTVLIWHKNDDVFYRAMKDWELDVLTHLGDGVGEALEFAPEDAEAVGEFFRWLGSSHLIQGIRQD